MGTRIFYLHGWHARLPRINFFGGSDTKRMAIQS